MFGFGLGTLLGIGQLAIKASELLGGSGKEKSAAAVKEITDHPLVSIKGNPELERFLEDELIPMLVKLAHLVGSFERASDEVQP